MRDRLVAGGRRFCESALSTLREMGVDIRDPARVLLALKRLGAAKCEELFGAGEPDETYLRGRKPVLETDLVHQTMVQRDRLLADLAARTRRSPIAGRKIVVASTDVHEFAKFLLTSTLDAVGTQVIDCGINRDPEDIVKVAIETDPDAIVITTHNGVARSYATKLMEELRSVRMEETPVYMGGVLNEDVDGSDIPVDVRADLRALGIRTPQSIDELIASVEHDVVSSPVA